uniref:MULE transposase domain-containing protein n=1 Tax=Acrobeloides nanus TaxID=290746 RepID=A0A914DZ39_9BILA
MEEFYEFFVLNEAVQEEDLEEGEILSEPEDQIVPILENQSEQIQDQMVPVQIAWYNSRKRKLKLSLDGFAYNLNYKNRKGVDFYYCDQRTSTGCKGSVSYVEEISAINSELYEFSEHNMEGKSKPIVDDKLKSISREVKDALPDMQSMTRGMRRHRTKNHDVMVEPLTFEEIKSENFGRYITGNGEKVFHLKITEPSKMLIFGCPSGFDLLRRCTVWSADATFKSVPMPKIFKQLLVIMGLYNGVFVPCVYVLMSKKKRVDDYLRIIEELPLSNDVEIVLIDFEKALIKAWKSAFVDMQLSTKCHGCRFHYSQALIRKLKKLKLINEYYEKGELFNLLRPLFLLAFVPENDVVLVYNICKREIQRIRPDVARFIRYFEETWIGYYKDGIWRRPRYEIELWNCQELFLNRIPITNNAVEAFHRAFRWALGVTYPCFDVFMTKLCNEYARVEYVLGIRIRDPIEHFYYDIVENYDDYRCVLSFFDAMIEVEPR